MKDRIEFLVHLAYDDEAKVWYISSSDIPGLSLEAANPSELLRRIVECAPELIELNSGQMAKVVRADMLDREDSRPGKRRPSTRSRPWAVRPVFDTPLDLARA